MIKKFKKNKSKIIPTSISDLQDVKEVKQFFLAITNLVLRKIKNFTIR